MGNETLSKLLEKDELVLWSGKPAPFKILDEYYKPVFIRNFILVCIAVAAILIMVRIFYADSSTLNMKALYFLLCVPFVAIISGLFSSRGYRNKCNYYLTNKNIIVYISDTRKRQLPLQNIDKSDSVNQSEGTRSIRFGKAVGIPIKKNRSSALNFLNSNAPADKEEGCVLFNLSEKDARTVLDLIEKYRVVA